MLFPGVALNVIVLPGALNLLMSEKYRFENSTPTSGPGGLFRTGGGKCCCTMYPAVRELKAFWVLLRKAAVPALEMALPTTFGSGVVPFTLQTARTQPSRSRTAMTLFDAIETARVEARATMFETSVAVSCADTLSANAQNK